MIVVFLVGGRQLLVLDVILRLAFFLLLFLDTYCLPSIHITRQYTEQPFHIKFSPSGRFHFFLLSICGTSGVLHTLAVIRSFPAPK